MESTNRSRTTLNKLFYRNELHVISHLREVTTPETSSSTNKLGTIRQIHESFVGYICPIYTKN